MSMPGPGNRTAWTLRAFNVGSGSGALPAGSGEAL